MVYRCRLKTELVNHATVTEAQARTRPGVGARLNLAFRSESCAVGGSFEKTSEFSKALRHR